MCGQEGEPTKILGFVVVGLSDGEEDRAPARPTLRQRRAPPRSPMSTLAITPRRPEIVATGRSPLAARRVPERPPRSRANRPMSPIRRSVKARTHVSGPRGPDPGLDTLAQISSPGCRPTSTSVFCLVETCSTIESPVGGGNVAP